MSGSAAKAKMWLEKAEKKEKSWFGGSGKYEDAAEMYEKAANLYKLGKQWKEAADAFCAAAACHLKVPSNHEAATSYISAANVLKKHDTTNAVLHLTSAVELYTEDGRFALAAKHEKDIAEMLEQDMDFEGAIDHYRTAAEYYEGENSSAAANGCLLKVALFSAQLERWSDAIEIYESVGSKSVDNALIKWSVKDYFMRASLCYLASGDLVGGKRAFERYCDMDVSFSSTREGKFVEEIMKAVEAYDVEAFTNAVVEYDSISKLDQWKTSVLLKVKKGIAQSEGDGDGDDDLL